MRILIILFVCSALFSCRIAYVRSAPPPQVEKIIIIERPLPHPGGPHPIPVRPKPEKPAEVKDKHKKRSKRPVIKRPKRDNNSPSKARKKAKPAHTR